jgi:hypothetical protein
MTIQSFLPALSSFAWPLSALALGLAAMLIFREPIGTFIRRSHEWKAGGFFSAKAKPSGSDSRIIEQAIRKILETSPGQDQADVDRLVIRDAKGRPRLLASTVESGAPFLALIDEDGEVRATLAAGSAAEPGDPDGIVMLMFRGKGIAPHEMASFIGAERDGTGAVGVRDSSGGWKEMS